jgi:DNA-directed RNA polymerase I subunit RPA1
VRAVAAMNISNSLPAVVKSVSFSFLSPGDVRKISVKQIVNTELFDNLNRPTIGGLYDPSLGPTGRQDMFVSFTF